MKSYIASVPGTMDVDDLEERIDEFKHKHESNTEWNLRKTFMLAHMDKYPLNRLVCLAACFINYECYGCTYPGPVMVELKELMEEIGDVLEEHRTTITQARQLQFVKSSGENFEPYSRSKKSSFDSMKKDVFKRPSFKISKDASDVQDSKSGGKKKKMTFVKASDDYSSTDVDENKVSDSNKSNTDPWMSTLGTDIGLGGAENRVKSKVSGKKTKMSFVKASDDDPSIDEGQNKGSHSNKSNTDPWMSTLGTDSGLGGAENKVKSKVSGKKAKMSFVKASDDDQSTDEGQNKGSHGNKRGHDPWLSALGMGGEEDSAENEVRSELLDKFYTLKGHMKECLSKTKHHPVSALHMAARKAQLSVLTYVTESKSEKGKYDCLLKIGHVDIATATARNKRNAKNNACEQAIAEFQEPYLKIEKRDDGSQILEGSQAPFSNEGLLSPTHSHVPVKAKLMESGLAGVTKLGKATSSNITALAKKAKNPRGIPRVNMSRTLEEFMIIEHYGVSHLETDAMNTNILRQSADFNRMSLDYDFRLDTVMGESRVRCLVSLQGNIMAEVEGTSNQNAKHLASTKCMKRLRQMCWTIQIKQAADSSDLGLSREQVLGDLAKTSEAIPESNIGNKLLKAMGWKGGGVGKKGTGIAEPVNVEAVINREGLGLKSEQGFSKDFYPAMKSVVLNYTKSSDQNDLVFSPDFSKEERATIHKICQQFSLKTRSYGVGDERYLVASRRRTPNQLFNHILESGGETSKYILKPPGWDQ